MASTDRASNAYPNASHCCHNFHSAGRTWNIERSNVLWNNKPSVIMTPRVRTLRDSKTTDSSTPNHNIMNCKCVLKVLPLHKLHRNLTMNWMANESRHLSTSYCTQYYTCIPYEQCSTELITSCSKKSVAYCNKKRKLWQVNGGLWSHVSRDCCRDPLGVYTVNTKEPVALYKLAIEWNLEWHYNRNLLLL